MNLKYTLIHLLWLMTFATTACNALPVESPTPFAGSFESQTLTPTIPSVDNANLFLPHCERDPQTGLSLETSPGKYVGWYQYTNETYGFSLAFPPGWELIEGQNYVCVRPQYKPTTILIVGFRRDSEDLPIQRTGVGAGDISTIGKVNFLGQEISRDVLRYQNKDKAILYNFGMEINTDGMIFTLSLEDFHTDYDMAELSVSIQSTTDTIIESFKSSQ